MFEEHRCHHGTVGKNENVSDHLQIVEIISEHAGSGSEEAGRLRNMCDGSFSLKEVANGAGLSKSDSEEAGHMRNVPDGIECSENVANRREHVEDIIATKVDVHKHTQSCMIKVSNPSP